MVGRIRRAAGLAACRRRDRGHSAQSLTVTRSIGARPGSLGFILLALLSAQPGDASIIWRIVVCGFGFGFFQSPNNRAIVSNAPRERSGGAGAIQATARLLGQTIGAALVALVFGYAGPGGGTSPTTAILIAGGFSALATLASLSRLLNFVRLPRRASVRASGMPNPNRDRVPVRAPP
jgi:predicted MFS family arabinose efflux permease